MLLNSRMMRLQVPLLKLSAPYVRRSRLFSTQLFDANLKQRHFAFAASNTSGDFEYLREEMAAQLVDRVCDIRKDFPYALDLGCHKSAVLQAMLKNEGGIPGAITHLKQVAQSAALLESVEKLAPHILQENPHQLETSFLQAPLHRISKVVAPNSVDLVVSNLVLHWTDDIQAAFAEVNKILKPDGAFLVTMFAGDTLFELRTALSIAEQEREGGISAHVSPMIRPADGCGLLNGAGFTLTTVDTVNIEIEFESAFSCMEHLNAMGESNAVLQRRANIKRETMLCAAAAYQSLFGKSDGYVPATFQIVCMIGWKKDESQPKPKPIGSANQSLGALGDSYDFTRHIAQPPKTK